MRADSVSGHIMLVSQGAMLTTIQEAYNAASITVSNGLKISAPEVTINDHPISVASDDDFKEYMGIS